MYNLLVSVPPGVLLSEELLDGEKFVVDLAIIVSRSIAVFIFAFELEINAFKENIVEVDSTGLGP